MGSKWSVRWTAGTNATLDDPLELVIVKAHAPPARARIEIWESDARANELDNYDDRKLGDDDDDKIATFVGTLEADLPRPDGRRFAVEKVERHYTGPQGADEVKIRFEGDPKIYELAIPHFREEPIDIGEGDKRIVGDGEFYEIYAKIFDADTGDKITTVTVHNLRRKLDRLLAVEPLNQASAGMNNALGQQILDYFHEGSQATANRHWGEVRCRGGLQMGAAGCAWASFTMVLRYLQELTNKDADPTDENNWVSLYDKVVGSSSFPEKHRPAAFDNGPDGGGLAKLRAKLEKQKKTKGWTSVGAVQWDSETVSHADVPAAAFSLAAKHEHWWPVRLAWALREDDGVTFDDKFTRLPAYVECVKDDGTVERVDVDTNWMFPESEATTAANRMVNSDNKPITAPAALLKKFGLTSKIVSIDESHGSDWVEFAKKTLDAGLPLVANIKSGRYLRDGADPGGHFVVIVGYRREKDRIRFIINDPAGAAKLQYACLFEDEVAPSLSTNEQVTRIDATAVVFRKEGKGKGKGDEVARAALTFSAEEIGSTDKQATLSVGGNDRKLVVRVKPGAWNYNGNAKAELLDKVEVDCTLDEVVGTPVAKVHWLDMGARKADGEGTLPKGDKWRFSKSPAGRSWTDPTDPTITYTVDVSLACGTTIAEGPRPPRAREGKYNLMLGRRRFDSLAILFVFKPKSWTAGAARFVPMTATAAAGG